MKTATKIKDLEGFRGHAALYRLSEPMEDEKTSWDWVVVSAVEVPFVVGEETLIFPSDENGEIAGWSELDGSFRGAMNHQMALEGAGYEIG